WRGSSCVLRARLATAAVAIPTLLALILVPSRWPLAVFIVAVGVIGVAEYATMAFPAQRGDRFLTIALGAILTLGACLQAIHVPAMPHWLGAALALTIAAGLVWTLLGRPDFERGLADLGLALIGILYVGFLLPHFVFLQGLPLGPRWVIFVVAIGMAGDTGGYMVGHLIGRHKLMPRVSPGKTIEGAVGIVAGSLLAAAICKLLFLADLGWTEAITLSLVMAIIGQLGDLCESVMKRTFGAKESGWLFPGHGGVLDRIDSLLFPVAFLYYYILLFR
ncbi:MAG: phosphatidate cytidylyltransferase, partial [Gaiellaceae bacterium]